MCVMTRWWCIVLLVVTIMDQTTANNNWAKGIKPGRRTEPAKVDKHEGMDCHKLAMRIIATKNQKSITEAVVVQEDIAKKQRAEGSIQFKIAAMLMRFVAMKNEPIKRFTE